MPTITFAPKEQIDCYEFLYDKLHNKLITIAHNKGFTDKMISKHPFVMAILMMNYLKDNPHIYY